MNRFKNCPFCGHEVLSVEHTDFNEVGWFIGCPNIGCLVRPSGHYETKEQAYEMWNYVPDVYEPLKIEIIEPPRFNAALSSVRLPKDQDISKYSTEETAKLLSGLIPAGDDHAKAVRGIDVAIQMKCQTGWLIEYLTYKVGVTPLSSSSSMHNELKVLKGRALANQKQADLAEKVYTRNEKITYQTLRRMYKQRLGHRHPDWKIFTDWIESLPLFDEFIMPKRGKH